MEAPLPKLLVTIDGPAGAGKTTVSRMLAGRTGYTYVDTGALYRAVALLLGENGVDPDNSEALSAFLSRLTLELAPTPEGPRLLANGADVSERIRTPEISLLSSSVSAIPAVRAFLLEIQRRLAAGKAAVFEGRDMGTVVFPDADVKIFLTADPRVRAERRYREFRHAGGPSLCRVASDMKKRDTQDATRKLAPLAPAEDAHIIDCTHLDAAEVVDRIHRILTGRRASPLAPESRGAVSVKQ